MAAPDDPSDPRWDSKFRRQLRYDMRTALVATQRDKEDITVPDELIKRIQNEDNLYKNVVSSREAVIDSEHFRLLSEIGRHQSQIARGELVHFDHRVYAQKLLTLMGGQLEGDVNYLEWNKLGEMFMPAFKTVPCGQFMYGALETVPLVQKVRNARRTKNTAKTIERPKEVSLAEEAETTTKDVSNILSILKRLCRSQGKVHYFKFLVDPNCYAHTVENIFHFAFLIKEGRAGVQIEEDGEEASSQSGQSSTTRGSCHQGITSIDMDSWKRLIDKHQITEAIIKRR